MNQYIRVKGHCLTLHQQGPEGRWQTILRAYCGYGRNGFSNNKKEGDGCTPIGTFTMEEAFGTVSDIEFKARNKQLDYRKIGPNSYWSGEREDYNRWVEVKPETRSMSASEHLADYPVQYKYAMSIGYNTKSPIYGAGSAIFLHCKGPKGWPTAGCISIKEEKMLELLALLKPGATIEIVE